MDALVPNGILGKYLWSLCPPIIVNYGLLSCGQTSFSGNDPIICFAWSRKHTIIDHKKISAGVSFTVNSCHIHDECADLFDIDNGIVWH